MLAKKANTMIIIFLAVLNVALATLNTREWQRYRLSDVKAADISTILENRGVIINVDIPRRFAPMKTLTLSPFPFSNSNGTSDFAGILFASDEIPKRVETLGEIVLTHGTKTLTFINKGFRFEDTSESQGRSDETAAVELADNLAASMGALSPGLGLERKSVRDEGEGHLLIEYRGAFKSYTIYSSFLRVRIGGGKLTYARGDFYLPEDFQASRDVYAADEALYALGRELRRIYGVRENESPITVDGIDIVYLVESSAASTEEEVKAEPYYKFEVSIVDEPIFINAFTNEPR